MMVSDHQGLLEEGRRQELLDDLYSDPLHLGKPFWSLFILRQGYNSSGFSFAKLVSKEIGVV